MEILNICYDDYANYMHSQTMAMKAVGMNVEGMKLRAHSFGYSEQLPIVTSREMKRAIRHADLVQIFHSCKTSASLIREVDITKPITVWHTGSAYRSDPLGVKLFFSQLNLKKSFTDQCEFLMIDPSLHYVAVAVPELCNKITNSINKLTVAHYPSKSETKGTNDIMRMLHPFSDRCNVIINTDLVCHAEQFYRMNNCDVYVELFKLKLNGKPYGCFGVTAFEVASLGKIVITNNIYKEAYESVYGKCELIIANTEEGFATYMNDLLSMTTEQITNKKQSTLEWCINNHSYKSTGERIKKILSDL